MSSQQQKKPKISIIGAGNVGTRYAYSLLISKTRVRQIVLVDIDKNRAQGEAMDLSHGLAYTRPVDIRAGDYQDIKDSDIVVITAGRGQAGPDETRLDLVKGNVKIYKQIIPQVMEHAPQAILLIVSNPVDILTYAAYKISGKPPGTVIGSGTTLDTARLRYKISETSGVDSRNIHAYILGEHGDTSFPVWSKATIAGMSIKEYCPLCDQKEDCDHEKHLNEVFKEVRDSAYKIIEKKGETSYGIGLALTRITKAILHDEHAILPVSVLVEDYYEVEDVYLSLPALIDKRGVNKKLHLALSEPERHAFLKSAKTLKDVLNNIDW